MTTLPPDVELARRYVDGVTSPAETVRVEQAMDGSESWRALVGSHVAPDRLDENLAAIWAEVDAPRRSLVERMMVRAGLREHVARLLAATPVMRRSWYLATILVLFFGMAAASPDRGDGSLSLFLALAPLVPVLGVAMAYGPGIDPAYDMTLAAPLSGFRLLLLRSCAVLATSVAFGGVASILLAGEQGVRVVAWMLPALALTTLVLLGSSVMATRTAAAAVGGSWLLVVAVATRAADGLTVFGGAAQLVYLGTAVVATAGLFVRRVHFDAIGGVSS